MSRCYELMLLESLIQECPAGQHPEEPRFNAYHLELTPDAEEALDKIVEPYGTNSTILMMSLSNHITSRETVPWAVICLDQEYSLAGHLCEVRPEPAYLRFAFYDKNVDINSPGFIPKVGVIVAMSKDALSLGAATGSLLLANAWELLKDKSEYRQWLCLPDPPPSEWLAHAEDIDNHLYQEQKFSR